MEAQEDGSGTISLRQSSGKQRVNTEEYALTDGEKGKMLVAVLLSNMICGTMILNIASFYPLYVE